LHLGETETRLDDLVVLCANCHRIAHRMDRLPTLESLRATLR
jgi:5-methylcytosine-specific restriction protein A